MQTALWILTLQKILWKVSRYSKDVSDTWNRAWKVSGTPVSACFVGCKNKFAMLSFLPQIILSRWLSFHQPPPVHETRNGHIRIYTSQYMRKMCQVSGTKILFILPGLYYPAWQVRAHERRPLPLSSRAMVLLPRGQLRPSYLQPQPPVWWYSCISSVQFKSEIQAVNLWRIYAVVSTWSSESR